MSGEFAHTGMPDGCPPEDATQQSILAYYYCYAVPPGDGDFAPLAVQGPTRPYRTPQEECRARGVSLYVDRQDALDLGGVPKFREMILVTLQIAPTDGVVKHTPSRDRQSHHTFWSYENANFRSTVRRLESGDS
jgi:hypothetical protein